MQVVDSEGYLKVKLVGGPVGPFVPYTGATANVDLGEYEIKAGQFTLDTSPTGTAVVGTTRWNNTIGSSETTLKGGSVILKNGVDLVARVVNKVTPNTTLTKAGYAAVRVSGAQGQRLAVAYAQADSDANSADTIGLVTETIATNQEGFIMTVGQLEGVNTTGSLQGETWVDGSVLYLSPTIPGALTNIKPNGLTGHIIVIGYVEYAHAINGKIYVKIMNGWELDELHNVYINPATIANNNILQYDSADQLWKNQVLNTGITIGTTAITSGTVGRVLFEGAGNVVQQSSSLFWDAINNRLGIGTSSPARALDILGSGDVLTGLKTSSATGVSSHVVLNDINSSSEFGVWGSTRSTFGAIGSNNAYIYSSVDFAITSLTNIKFGTGASLAERMRIVSGNGNVLINTTTDAGFKLDVNGTARVKGTGTTFATTSFSVINNANTSALSILDNLSVYFGGEIFGPSNFYINGPTANTGVGHLRFATLNFPGGSATSSVLTANQLLANGEIKSLSSLANVILQNTTSASTWRIENHRVTSGALEFKNDLTNPVLNLFSTRNVGIGTFTDSGYKLDVNGTARVTSVTAGVALVSTWSISASYARFGHNLFNGGTTFGFLQQQTGDCFINGLSNFFAATNNNIFETNGAERMRITSTGNVLIGTTTNGASKLRLVGLPTSAAGLSAGDIWNDAGTLKIV